MQLNDKTKNQNQCYENDKLVMQSFYFLPDSH